MSQALQLPEYVFSGKYIKALLDIEAKKRSQEMSFDETQVFSKQIVDSVEFKSALSEFKSSGKTPDEFLKELAARKDTASKSLAAEMERSKLIVKTDNTKILIGAGALAVVSLLAWKAFKK